MFRFVRDSFIQSLLTLNNIKSISLAGFFFYLVKVLFSRLVKGVGGEEEN